MRLICLDTGEEIKPDANGNIICKRGMVKGDLFQIGEIVAPCAEHPDGLVRSKRTGISWVEYYPSVFNAKIVC